MRLHFSVAEITFLLQFGQFFQSNDLKERQ